MPDGGTTRAGLHLVIGLAIGSLVPGAAANAGRTVTPHPARERFDVE